MLEKNNIPKNQDGVSSESNSSSTNSRRSFLVKAALAAPVITTIAAKPVWAGDFKCTVSGMLSGNLSHHTGEDHCDGYGFSPGGWQKDVGHPYEWPAPLARDLTLTDLNDDSFGGIKDQLGHTTDIVPRNGASGTLHSFIAGNDQYERRFVQGLLNTRAFDLGWYQGNFGSYETDKFPFLYGWPYTIEQLIIAYNTGDPTYIFADIADKEF